MKQDFMPAEQIELDAGTDAVVIGNIKTQDFLIIAGVAALSLLLFGLLAFIPVLVRALVFLIPIGAGLFFQMDGPRKLKIRREFSARPREIAAGNPLAHGYDWKPFETLKNFIVQDGQVMVFANLILPPTDLLSDSEYEMLTEGVAAMVRTAVQVGAVLETYLFHRSFVPERVENLTREKYWMETGTSRYVTELYVRLIFAGGDVAKAETLSNRIRRAYYAGGGKGEWIWVSAANAAQESHDALNPGALRKRYLEVIADASRRAG
ncbi:hypothetical protein CEB3_c18550 [Peptococcaceae bacterium CEB3]|nr:hypothetical protein CEB3_c18550 [Peptococcaceae bacterium CEB3]